MVSDNEYFFMYLLVIRTFKECLFISAAHVLIGSFILEGSFFKVLCIF